MKKWFKKFWAIAVSVIVTIISLLAVFLLPRKKKEQKTSTEYSKKVDNLKEKVDKTIEEKYADRNITSLVNLMNKQLRKKK